jgi:hypothetical protein
MSRWRREYLSKVVGKNTLRAVGHAPDESATTAFTSISAFARFSMSAATATPLMAGKFLPITLR